MQGKLGFGLMRLPRKGISIDIKETCEMIDMFLDRGFNYFDTAHIYPGSEVAAQKALFARHDRESFTIATKLFAPVVPTKKMAENEFYESLKRMKTDYIDYYLLHFLNDMNYKKYERFELWDFVQKRKDEGKIKHIGFSFHGGPEVLDEILSAHPEVEFVQLQINYADWENPGVQGRKNYEVVRKYDKQLVIMEPVKGGRLADPPKAVKALFDKVNPNASYASWAIRFAASLDGLLSVLSGMSTLKQVDDNTTFMSNFTPLSKEEREAINEAQKVFAESKEIPCTACHYCTDGCPKQIPIPDVFSVYNKRMTSGEFDESAKAYEELKNKGSVASDCIACKKCESVCPQHIKISEHMKEIREVFT